MKCRTYRHRAELLAYRRGPELMVAIRACLRFRMNAYEKALAVYRTCNKEMHDARRAEVRRIA